MRGFEQVEFLEFNVEAKRGVFDLQSGNRMNGVCAAESSSGDFRNTDGLDLALPDFQVTLV